MQSLQILKRRRSRNVLVAIGNGRFYSSRAQTNKYIINLLKLWKRPVFPPTWRRIPFAKTRIPNNINGAKSRPQYSLRRD